MMLSPFIRHLDDKLLVCGPTGVVCIEDGELAQLTREATSVADIESAFDQDSIAELTRLGLLTTQAALTDLIVDGPWSPKLLRTSPYRDFLYHSTWGIATACAVCELPFTILSPGNISICFGDTSVVFECALPSDGISPDDKMQANDKLACTTQWRAGGVAAPESRMIDNRALEDIALVDHAGGYVVKPRMESGGRGVVVGIRTPAELWAAVSAIENLPAILEPRIEGRTFRLLMFRGELVAAYEKLHPRSTADGQTSIEHLIVEATGRPVTDDARIALREQGFTPDDVPAAGVEIRFANVASNFRGALAVDVTPRVADSVVQRAGKALRLLGMEAGGVDYIARDIESSPEDAGGHFIEAEPFPGILWLRRGSVCPTIPVRILRFAATRLARVESSWLDSFDAKATRVLQWIGSAAPSAVSCDT